MVPIPISAGASVPVAHVGPGKLKLNCEL